MTTFLSQHMSIFNVLDEQLIREYLMLMILMKSSGLENHYNEVDENLRNDFNLAELFNDRDAEILEEIK